MNMIELIGTSAAVLTVLVLVGGAYYITHQDN